MDVIVGGIVALVGGVLAGGALAAGLAFCDRLVDAAEDRAGRRLARISARLGAASARPAARKVRATASR